MSCEIEQATSFITDAQVHLNAAIHQLQTLSGPAINNQLMTYIETLFGSIDLYIKHLRQELKKVHGNSSVRKGLRTKINELENMRTLILQQMHLKATPSRSYRS